MGFLSLLLNIPFSLHHFPPSLNFKDFVVAAADNHRAQSEVGCAEVVRTWFGLNMCTFLHISLHILVE